MAYKIVHPLIRTPTFTVGTSLRRHIDLPPSLIPLLRELNFVSPATFPHQEEY